MPDADFVSIRLFVTAALSDGARITATDGQHHYLRHVMRLGEGDRVLLFNGRDGEWQATLAPSGKRGLDLVVGARQRAQTGGPDIVYLFAPLKRSRLDYVVQKAVEMGVARLQPVLTRRTQTERLNLERMRANVIEAAEQCGVLRLPEIGEPIPLSRALAAWEPGRRLVFCDEAADVANPLRALGAIPRGAPVGVLIGPEGGFAPEEREMLLAQPMTLRLALGPRIMRADTAAVAVLALVNAVAGDWA